MDAATSANLLEVTGLTKHFGGVRAVTDARITIPPGQIHGLIGPNGAGKSTLLGLISGFIPPDAGSIRWEGQELVGRSPLHIVRAGIARTFQAATPMRGLSALENILVGLHTQGRAGVFTSLVRTPPMRHEERALHGRATALLHEFLPDVQADLDAANLPFGQLRFLEIARAFATGPRLLLLDEPAAGLNAAETQRLAAIVAQVRARGTAVLLIDHDVPFVFSTCEQITVMNFGEVIARGAPAEVERNADVRAAYLGDAGEASA